MRSINFYNFFPIQRCRFFFVGVMLWTDDDSTTTVIQDKVGGTFVRLEQTVSTFKKSYSTILFYKALYLIVGSVQRKKWTTRPIILAKSFFLIFRSNFANISDEKELNTAVRYNSVRNHLNSFLIFLFFQHENRPKEWNSWIVELVFIVYSTQLTKGKC